MLFFASSHFDWKALLRRRRGVEFKSNAALVDIFVLSEGVAAGLRTAWFGARTCGLMFLIILG